MTDNGRDDRDQASKDTSYSPASENETRAKQEGGVPDTVDPEAAEHVVVAPGTGGPDDEGDVRIDVTDVPHVANEEAPD